MKRENYYLVPQFHTPYLSLLLYISVINHRIYWWLINYNAELLVLAPFVYYHIVRYGSMCTVYSIILCIRKTHCCILTHFSSIALFLHKGNVQISPSWSVWCDAFCYHHPSHRAYQLLKIFMALLQRYDKLWLDSWLIFSLSFSANLKEFSERGVPHFHAGPTYSGGIRHHKSQLIDLIVSKCRRKASEREQPDRKKAHKIPLWLNKHKEGLVL